MDIHNYDKQFRRTLERIKESVDFSKENKKIAVEFKDYLLSENIGLSKINRYMLDLMKYNKMLGKGFSEANKDDLRRVIADLNQTDLAEETKKCFKIMLRKLYRFIRGVENPGEYSEEVKWISIKITENHKKLPEELLTDEEAPLIVSPAKKNKIIPIFRTINIIFRSFIYSQ